MKQEEEEEEEKRRESQFSISLSLTVRLFLSRLHLFGESLSFAHLLRQRKII